MKIRIGFVSNSSSSSYIVTISRTFDINDHLVLFTKCLLNHDECGDYITHENEDWINGNTPNDIQINEFKTKHINKFNEYIELLKEGDSIWRDENYIFYQAIVDALNDLGCVIGGVDTGPDSGLMSGVPFNTLVKQIIKLCGGDADSVFYHNGVDLDESNNSRK